ncbi:MAG: HD-GYP domain-containing protein [Coriobacteriia bacterium]|nr:HD-GYP domain-containing protein [Coriobacteriia bacterium]
MADTWPNTPRPFLILVAFVTATCLLVLSESWLVYPPVWSVQIALVAVAAATLEFFASKLPVFTVSLTYPLVMCAIVLGGPAASSLVAVASAVVITGIERRRPPLVLLFNFTQGVLWACLGGWAYTLLGGHVLATSPSLFRVLVRADFPPALYGMIGAALLACVVNLVLVSAGIATFSKGQFSDVFSSMYVFVPTQIALAFVGFLMAQVLAINILALPLFAFPLLFAQQLYQRYTTLKGAYADTVRSLIGALEAKDSYTRGHSERVADYSVALGHTLKLDSRTQERLEYAALLHDLGKLAVPGCVLTKPGALDDDEYRSIQLHPSRGAEMIRRIPPLSDLADYVGKHHERFGGGGYPEAISAPEIPLIARILAVADSYDAMTTTRAYRPALSREVAVSELVKGKGTQFDPVVVEAFIEGHVVDSLGTSESQVEATRSPQQLEVGES